MVVSCTDEYRVMLVPVNGVVSLEEPGISNNVRLTLSGRLIEAAMQKILGLVIFSHTPIGMIIFQFGD